MSTKIPRCIGFVSPKAATAETLANARKFCDKQDMTTKQEALRRDADGKCILCNTLSEARKRGLCRMHYQRYLRAWSDLGDPAEQDAFEQMLIERGQLLPTRKGRRLSDGADEFRDALAEFRATHGREPTAGAAELAAEAADIADAIEAAGKKAAAKKRPHAKKS